MASVRSGLGGCDVTRLQAAACHVNKLAKSSFLGLEVSGLAQLRMGLKVASPKTSRRANGISMNLSCNFSEADFKGPIRLEEEALKFYNCLEDNYQTTVEVASVWNEISLRSARKGDYKYAIKASFISRTSYDKAILIKAKADALRLFIENDNDHTKAVMKMLLEMGVLEEEPNAQDLGALKLIRGIKPTGPHMNVIDNFCQDEIEEVIKRSVSQILESRQTIDSAALDLHKCLQDNYEKAVDAASVWRGTSMHDARVENYSSARKAYFVSQSFYDVALLTKEEANNLQLFVIKQGADSEAAINFLREMPAYKMRKEENKSEGKN